MVFIYNLIISKTCFKLNLTAASNSTSFFRQVLPPHLANQLPPCCSWLDLLAASLTASSHSSRLWTGTAYTPTTEPSGLPWTGSTCSFSPGTCGQAPPMLSSGGGGGRTGAELRCPCRGGRRGSAPGWESCC